jgi:hypothetical protein
LNQLLSQHRCLDRHLKRLWPYILPHQFHKWGFLLFQGSIWALTMEVSCTMHRVFAYAKFQDQWKQDGAPRAGPPAFHQRAPPRHFISAGPCCSPLPHHSTTTLFWQTDSFIWKYKNLIELQVFDFKRENQENVAFYPINNVVIFTKNTTL